MYHVDAHNNIYANGRLCMLVVVTFVSTGSLRRKKIFNY